MPIGGEDTHYLSVGNLDRCLELFRDFMGMELVSDGMLDPVQVQRRFNLPAGYQARAAFLRSRLQTTLLGLIEFKPNSGKVIRQPKTHDYGHWASAFLVKSTDAVYEGLLQKGYKFVSPPFFYKPDWLPFSVKEVVLIGPDQITFGHFEKMGGDPIESPHNYIRFDHSAQYVKDIDEGIRFYRDTLGLDLRDDMTLSPGLLDQLLVVPPRTKTRTAMLYKKDQVSLTVQLIQVAVPGRSLADVARPPNRGAFLMSFQVDSLAEYQRRLEDAGAPVLSGPLEFRDPVHGPCQALITAGPNGEMVELFQR
jgi:catechol 2,3-dioxygenase-like lactoylglutathione lyase family enzyme